MSSSNEEKDDKGLPDRLPFSLEHQDAVLGHLLMKDAFFLQCVDKIEPRWFNSVLCSKIWAAKKNFYKEHRKIPSPQDVLEYKDLRAESQSTRGQCSAKVADVKIKMSDYSIEQIQTELTEWLHSRYFMEGVYHAKDKFNQGHFSEAYVEIEKAIRAIRESSFDSEVVYDFSNPAAIIEKRMHNVTRSLTFGHSLIDKLLLPEGNGNGSLLPGSSTTLVAPVNIGKTATMFNIIVPNLKAGKRVLFIAHEGNIDELRLKFLQVVLNRSNGWLIANVNNPDPIEQARIALAIGFLNNYLTFMPMIRAGLSVEQVVAAVRRKVDELGSRTGKCFDMVVDDYPAKLTTEEARGGKLEKRHKDEIIYMQFNRMAEEYGWHSLNAIQTNREGSKINRGLKGHEDRLLGMEDVLEAFGPMADTATVFTVNRDPFAKAKDFMILNNVKSRTSETDWAVVVRSHFANYVSHAEDLPACWYRGNSVTTPENYDSWLKKYNGQMIDIREKF